MADIITRRESAKRKANRFFINTATLMTMMVKRASRFTLKLKAAPPATNDQNRKTTVKSSTTKKLLKNITNKTMPFIEKMKKKKKGKEDWGDGGVWQKAIMMGDKCEPLDFSGVIYYDSKGEQVNEYPLRTPTASQSHAS
ncbi:unnamed protein product [Trifolium pratense]|uniref:Uncharacterized protein n=1 Tax=Trifolium pratense TaxID=57577 RepID=A0ACB0IYZ8_TRIPR|nr:unnamed protein product [Trifolium pratense]